MLTQGPRLERTDRKFSTGSVKGLGNYGGLDTIGATRRSVDIPDAEKGRRSSVAKIVDAVASTEHSTRPTWRD